MKYKTAIFVFLLATAGLVSAEERALGNFATVTNLWYAGHKSNVLAIAEQRLSINSNDLAGLVIRMDYNTAFLNADCFSNDIAAVMSAANIASGTHLDKVKPLLFFSLTNTLEYLAKDFRLTTDELNTERQKGFIPGKPMENEDVLEALHDDGLF